MGEVINKLEIIMTEATTTATSAEADAAKAAAAEADKAAKAKAKADAKAKKDQERADKKAAKEKEKADKKAAKEAAKAAAKQPEQNGITRPKTGTVTGNAWAVFDELSQKSGAPATIGDSIKAAPQIAEATVRTQYARWRKFHGITGKAAAPKPAETPSA